MHYFSGKGCSESLESMHYCIGILMNKQDLKQLVDGDLVVDMAPYFEEYASDYLKSLIEAAGEACINACTYNGVQYGIPYVDCDLRRKIHRLNFWKDMRFFWKKAF